MATFQKIEIVEAEKYAGAPLTLIHDHLGEQKAQAGDWLLGTERGKIRVMSAKQFEAEFAPYIAPDSSAGKSAAADKHKIAALTAQIADLNVSRENLRTALDDAMAEIADLKRQIASLKKQVFANTEVLREHPVSQIKTALKTVAKKK